MSNNETWVKMKEILREELIPAMGCTEPIAIAYAASRCRDLLGAVPDSVVVKSSGSVIKNVKSVIVPNTGQLKGIEAAAAAGIVAGITGKKLEVINAATDEQRLAIREYIRTCDIRIEHIETGHVFDICIEAAAGEHAAKVRIADHHTNIVYEELDGKVLRESLGGFL